MLKQIFILRVGLKSPKADATADLDFRNLQENISKACETSNNKHGYKKLRILEVTQKSIQLELEIKTESGVSNIGRELSTFSRALYNNFNWARFSSVPHRLFMVTESEEKSELYNETVPVGESEEAAPYYVEPYITDEEMLRLINFIVSFQNKGEPETINRRKVTIRNIKKWLEECM